MTHLYLLNLNSYYSIFYSFYFIFYLILFYFTFFLFLFLFFSCLIFFFFLSPFLPYFPSPTTLPTLSPAHSTPLISHIQRPLPFSHSFFFISSAPSLSFFIFSFLFLIYFLSSIHRQIFSHIHPRCPKKCVGLFYAFFFLFFVFNSNCCL